MNEELRKALDEMFATLKNELPKGLSKEDVTLMIADKMAAIEAKFENMVSNEELTKQMEAFAKNVGKEIKDLSTKEEGVKEVITKEALKDLTSTLQEKGKASVTVKAAAIMTTANITSGTHLTSYEVVPGIQAAPREPLVVLPALLKGVTSAKTIYWANRINEDGGAAFIGEGVLKPLKDWDYAEQNSVAKKVAVRGVASREMLADMAGFQADLENLLKVDLMEKIESELLDSTASSTTLTGIKTVASTYTTTALDDKIVNPNDVDAIRASVLQQRLLGYKPNVVFMNPAEVAVMDLTKDSSGNYIKLQVEGVLRTLKVIESTDIPAGYFLLMDTAKWNVKMLEDVTIEYGLDSDNFSKNLISVICEARLHSYYNTIDVGAFIYDDYATIKAQIAKP